jgi:DNA polymerase III delta prime subunit
VGLDPAAGLPRPDDVRGIGQHGDVDQRVGVQDDEVGVVAVGEQAAAGPGDPEVRRLVRESRLLTLSGPPGVGKTRLAIELGRAVQGEFPDGAWLVELAPLRDPGDVAVGVGSVLAVREPGRPMTAAGGAPVSSSTHSGVLHLRDRRVLLILDNCEHLLAGVAGLVEPLLTACPELHVLATSREALAVAGEATGWTSGQRRAEAVTGPQVLVRWIWSRYPPFCSP